MKTYITNIEHSEKETAKKWNGKFVSDDCYKKVFKHNEDFKVVSLAKNIFGEYEPTYH